jgi:peroxiredoxin Q/BCP
MFPRCSVRDSRVCGCTEIALFRGGTVKAGGNLHPAGTGLRYGYLMNLHHSLLAMSLLTFFGNQSVPAVEVGASAPKVTATDDAGQPVRFADFYREGVTLVYFYPKADTPGCTAQACSLRDSFEGLKARGVQILGVSEDKPEAQKRFREKYHLPFLLVADSDGAVAKAFGVPTFLGFAKRQSFLVKNGKVVWRNLNVSPATHVAEVNQALDSFK